MNSKLRIPLCWKASPIASPTVTTTYSLTVTDVNGCQATDSVKVTVNALPVVKATGDTTVCPGMTAPLLATGASTYLWTPINGLNNSGIPNPKAKPSVSTTYYVTGTDNNGCTDFDSVQVRIAAPPTANAGPDTSFCEGLSTQLNGTGGKTYSWLPTQGLDKPNVANPIASPTSNITYTLTVTDSNFCSATDQLVIIVHPNPTADAGPNQQICRGYAVPLNGSGGTTYHWVPSTFLDNDGIDKPVSRADSTISYELTVTDKFGCKDVDTTTVFVVQPFKAQVGPGATICQGEVVQLFASGGSIFSWSPATGLDNTHVANPFAAPSATTTYKVVTTDGACMTDSGFITIIVNPLATCDAGSDKTTPAGSVITLDGSAGYGSYSWSPATGLSCTDCLNPTLTATGDSTYVLTVVTPNGCRTEDTVHIHVACLEDVIYVPNAFTPNGDNKNETFRVRSYGLKQLTYLRIFNRWGQLIFESTDIDQGWDGTFNGVNVAPGVYVYNVEATCSSGEKISKEGNVTLIR